MHMLDFQFSFSALSLSCFNFTRHDDCLIGINVVSCKQRALCLHCSLTQILNNALNANKQLYCWMYHIANSNRCRKLCSLLFNIFELLNGIRVVRTKYLNFEYFECYLTIPFLAEIITCNFYLMYILDDLSIFLVATLSIRTLHYFIDISFKANS